MTTFDFEFDPRFKWLDLVLGVTPATAKIEVDEQRVVIRFGLWVIETTRANIVGASVTGPYAWWKVAGPARLSFADRGITLATNARRGVCMELRAPVRGIEPVGIIRHPGITVTPRDPEGLVRALDS